MNIDPNEIGRKEAYSLFTSVIVPRPIAWVTTLNENGSTNAAPFSFFMGVTSYPPRLAISASSRGGIPKDTAKNIIRTEEFVVNLVTKSNVEAMNITSVDYEYGVDELLKANLSTGESEKISTPCIKESPVNMECRLEKIVEIGEPTNYLIIGEVVLFHIDEAIYSEGVVDPHKLQSVGRLGNPLYSNVNDIFRMERP
ncbi:MAG: flavin reductase family protein [Candidatus Marinimicrobia bacterium]|nr:flavin reductase family protein [Candidatus Neomarinimicrobiota bacterium]MCH7955557.1 flavin reductase family protein [Candidatus Neomarinimicrobiota bacterium]